MFGKNPKRAIVKGDGAMLAVQEVFRTLQGEGPFVGQPATFIRFAGCNLACTFCDTEFESNINNVVHVDEIGALHDKLIVLTGGEPLRQPVGKLVNILLDRGHRVQIETAGVVWQPGLLGSLLSDSFSIVVSPKTPKVHAMISTYAYAWKYIVRDGDLLDKKGLPVVNTQREEGRVRSLAWPPERFPASRVYLQPCDEQDAALTQRNTLHAIDVCKEYGYTLSVQLHKQLNLP